MSRVIIFLALLNINLGNLFYFGDSANRITSFFLGILLLTCFLKENGLGTKRTAFRGYLPAVVSCTCLLLCFISQEAGLVGLVIALGCMLVLGLKDTDRDQISVFLTTTGFIVLFDYGYGHDTRVWYGVKKINHLLMTFIGIFTREKMAFGPHPSGFFILLTIVVYSFAFILCNRGKKRKAFSIIAGFCVFLFFVFMSQALYLFLQQRIFSRIQVNIYQTQLKLTPFGTHWVAFILFLIPLYLEYKGFFPLLSAHQFFIEETENQSLGLGQDQYQDQDQRQNYSHSQNYSKNQNQDQNQDQDQSRDQNQNRKENKSCLAPSFLPAKRQGGIQNYLIWSMAIALCFILLITWQRRKSIPLSSSHCDRAILIYDNLDWSKPVFGFYGETSGGMFGNLPDFLSSLGYRVQVASRITEEKLRSVGCLVLINLAEKLDKPAQAAIRRYVEKGGSLLIMGDHTGFGFIREPFNELLEPVHISFQFDSACSLVPSWQNCMEIRHHPITAHACTENDVQIWTGASLKVGYPAVPIIVGKRAFSDAGNLDNKENGYLGDLLYQQSEWLGDIVLAAEGRLGKGKVLVFGDTSSVQNGALPYSHQFVQDIFHWLMEEKKGTVQQRFRFLSFFLWALLLLSVAAVWASAPFTGVLCLVLGLYFAQLPGYYPLLPGPAPGCGEIRSVAGMDNSVACIDNSHGESFDTTGWHKNSIDGLLYNLIRNDYMPFIIKTLDSPSINTAGMLVFVNPTKTFSKEEKERLHHFLKQGGIILWTTDWPMREASLSFLADFGLAFVNLPLGPVKGKLRNYEVQFSNAWPISIEDWAAGETTTFFQKSRYPLVVFRKYGRGGILLISDACFLLNHNLEHIDFFQEGNILFFRDILNEVKS
ncbi:MAG: hypothetical protein AB1847_11155 [bacterium]